MVRDKLSQNFYANTDDKLNAPDFTGVYRLIGLAIIVFFVVYCHIGLALGLPAMVILYFKLLDGREDLAWLSKILAGISVVPAILASYIYLYRFRHPFFTYTNETDWLMILAQILITPVMMLGLSLLFTKNVPLSKRLSGWDKIPKDPKPVRTGKHIQNKALVGYRFEFKGKTKLPVYVDVTEPGKMGFVVAKTGSGKSAFISNIIEAVCEHRNYNGSFRFPIVIDGKADKTEYSLYSLMKREAKRTGRKLNVIDIANPEQQIDVFAGMDAVAVRDALIAMSEWSEQHYLFSASQFFTILAEVLFLTDDEAITFKTLAKYCQKAKITSLVNRLHREGKISETKLNEYLDTIEVTADIARAAAPRFAVMAQGVGEELFPTTKEECDSALSIIDAYKNDEMVLILINSLAYSEYAFSTGALIISALKQLVSQIQIGQLSTKGITCICDELGQYASETIRQLYQQGRTSDLQIWGIVQSLTDFNMRLNGDATRDTIIGNSSYIVNFSLTLPKDAEDLSDIYSTIQAPEVTTQISGEMKSGMGTAKVVDRYIVNPRTIKALPKLVGYIKFCGEDEPGPYRFTCRLVDFDK